MKDLEVFVRERLGQKKPYLCQHNEDHMRLSFHTAKSKDLINNLELVALFDDVWDAGDHDHTPIITGYKGSLNIGSTNGFSDKNTGIFTGYGTVEVMCKLIEGYIYSSKKSYNGVLNFSVDTKK